MSFENFPFIIGWELTLNCNLRCLHCASSAGSRRDKELTLVESIDICDQLPALLVHEVIFTGGEPLLNPHWAKIATHLRNLGIKTGMVSNGVLVNSETIAQMKQSGMTAIGISLDGPDDIHDSIRGVVGAFRKTINGITLLKNNGIDVTIITSVVGLNVDRLEEIYQLVRTLGAWKWQLQPLFPIGRSKQHGSLQLSEAQYLKMGEFIKNKYPIAIQEGISVVPADSCGYFSALDIPEVGWAGCSAGITSCGIMSDGRVKGCLSWPDHTAEGNLRKDDLWSIWFRPEAFSMQRSYSKTDIKGPCTDCDVSMECGGGCQAMSIAAEDQWHADPYCYRRLLKQVATC